MLKKLHGNITLGKYYEIVEKLLELGADPNAKDMAGKTAIYHAMNIDLDYEHKEKLIGNLF